MKIYTKTGDKGKTSLWGGRRVSKASLRVEAYGTVDELNSYMGVIAAYISDDQSTRQEILDIQADLMVMGSDLATPLDVNENVKELRMKANNVIRLEKSIDEMDNELKPLTSFILPGGHAVAAQLQYARSVCRRAERLCVELDKNEDINPEVLRYLNRLSDWLFTASRYVNLKTGVDETTWQS